MVVVVVVILIIGVSGDVDYGEYFDVVAIVVLNILLKVWILVNLQDDNSSDGDDGDVNVKFGDFGYGNDCDGVGYFRKRCDKSKGIKGG